MILTLRNIFLRHIKLNKVRYFFLIICLIIGIIAGVLFVGIVPQNQTAELSQYISTFTKQTTEQAVSSVEILKASIMGNIRIITLIWICGLFFILSPVIYGIVALKGFGIGFTIGFLSIFFGFKGFMLSLVSIVPQSIIALPALIFIAFCSIRFASIRRKRGDIKGKYDNKIQIKRNVYLYIIGSTILLSTSIIDAFIVPVFVKSICGLFIT